MYLLTTYTGGITITIKRIALLSIIVTYFLIVFGGYVASSESGMGCGPFELKIRQASVLQLM